MTAGSLPAWFTILDRLCTGEASGPELERELGIRHATLQKALKALWADGLIKRYRRNSRKPYTYSVTPLGMRRKREIESTRYFPRLRLALKWERTGDTMFRNGRTKGAIHAYNRALALYEDKGVKPHVALLRKLAEALLVARQLEEAGDILDSVETEAKADPYERALILSLRGELFSRQGEGEKAVHVLSKARKLCRNDKDAKQALAEVYHKLGAEYYRQRGYALAKRMFTRARDSSGNEDITYVKASRNLIMMEYRQSRYNVDSLTKILGQLEDLEKGLEEDVRLASYKPFESSAHRWQRRMSGYLMTDKALIHSELCKYKAAIDTYKEGIDLDRKLGNLAEEALKHTNIANCHVEQGDYQGALREARSALRIARKLGERRLLDAANCVAGYAYSGMSQLNKADEFFDAVLEARQRGDPLIVADASLGKARVALKAGGADSALKSLLQAKEALRGVADQHVEAVAELVEADILTGEGKKQKAQAVYERCLRNLAATCKQADLAIAHFRYNASLAKWGLDTQARDHYSKARAIWSRFGVDRKAVEDAFVCP